MRRRVDAQPHAGEPDHDCGICSLRIVSFWHTRTATARRVKGRICSIMRWAIVQNYIRYSPGWRQRYRGIQSGNGIIVPARTRKSEQHCGRCVTRTRLLFEPIALTAPRSSEALSRSHIWNVPEERVTGPVPHGRIHLKAVQTDALPLEMTVDIREVKCDRVQQL